MEPENLLKSKKVFFKRFWWMFVLAVILLLLTAFGVFTFLGKINGSDTGVVDSNSQNADKTSKQGDSEAVKQGKMLSNGNCTGEDKPKLTTLPMKYDDFKMIIPYGLVIGGHVTPIDHQYFSPTVFQFPRDKYEVYAMADSKLVDIGERINDRGTEYRLVFSLSCKLFYYYDLVTSLTLELKKAYEDNKIDKQKSAINIPVKAGGLIGRIGGQTLDFAVWDTDIRLIGFVIPEHYAGEIWKIHTADPLNYYTTELKAQAVSKYIRTAEPISGKIDYDIDGKLVGNWFQEGTGGYTPAGTRGGEGYWKGHLSIAYDHYDPTSIVISMGEYAGKEAQFAVNGNTPDPVTVDVAKGLVKYELILQDWADPKTGKMWDRDSLVKGIVAKNHENQVEGTVFVQMLENRKIKFEAFPGKKASQVTAFTTNAKIFER